MYTLSIVIQTKNRHGGGFAAGALKLGLRSPAAQKIIERRFSRAGVDLVSELKKEAPIDTGNVRRAHGYAVDTTGSRLFVFNRSQYAVWAHEGRKSGKRPPIEALIPWCRRHIVNARITKALAAGATKGLRKSATKSELQEARSYAFALARWIGIHGTKPNRWFDRVLQNYGLKRLERAAVEIGNDLGALTAAAIEKAAIDAQRGIAY